jgi:hypothetical protein
MNGLNGLHGFMLGAPPPVQARAKRRQNLDHILHKIILNFVLLNHNQFSTLRGKGLRVLHPSHPATFWRHVLFQVVVACSAASAAARCACSFFAFLISPATVRAFSIPTLKGSGKLLRIALQ